jgi:C4-dicarboxylate-specific signal transduction histidine kinase
MIDARQPQATRRNPSNWLQPYLLLVFFVVGTLAISGWLNHRLILTHRHSVAVNKEWVNRLKTADEMARQASAVVQPVNGALQSRDPAVEAAQSRAAHTLFDNTILAHIQALQGHLDDEQRQVLTRDCQEVIAQMDAAVAVINQVFEAVRTGATAQATERLTALNKEYDDVLVAFQQLRTHYRQQRQAFMDSQLADAAGLGRRQTFMVGLALMILVSFALYGVRLSRHLRATEAQVRAANQEVADSRDFVQATMDSLQAHVCVVAEDGTILAVNQAWRDFAAANPPINGNIGEGADYLAICDAATGPDAEIAHAFATGIRAVIAGTRDRFELEYPCHSPQQHRWFVGRVTRLIGAATRRVVVAHENITERKEAEEAVRSKNEELEQFTYAVSHDLRSPVVTIQTFLGHLEKDIPAQHSDRVAADLNFIRTAASKMAQLLDELLKLSRVGRQVNPPSDVLLQAVVQEALDLVAGRLSQRGEQVTVTQDPVTLHGDRAHFVGIFQNLVDNACKFMGDQKEPRIEVGTMRNADCGLRIAEFGKAAENGSSQSAILNPQSSILNPQSAIRNRLLRARQRRRD